MNTIGVLIGIAATLITSILVSMKERGRCYMIKAIFFNEEGRISKIVAKEIE